MVWQFILGWIAYRLPTIRMPKDSTAGQGLAEYGLILVLVAVAVIAILAALGPVIGNMYQNIMDNFPTS